MLVDRKTWIYVKQALDFFSDVDNVPFCNDYLHTKTFFLSSTACAILETIHRQYRKQDSC